MPKISDLTAILSVDPSDYVVVVDVSDMTTKRALVSQVQGSSFTAGGDLSGTSSSQTVSKVRGATVNTAGGALTTGNVLKVTGASTIDYGAVNLGGGAGHVTGTLPIGNGGTGLTAVPGLSGQLILNAGGTAYGASSHWSMSGTGSAGFTGSSSAYVAMGTNPAGAGWVRVPYASAQDILMMRNSGNSADWNLIGMSSSTLVLGDSNMDSIYRAFGLTLAVAFSTGLDVIVASGNAFRATNSIINCAQPVAGDQRVPIPFRWASASITQSSTTTTTLTAAQAECPLLKFTGSPGGAFDVRAPSVADAFFIVANGTNGAMTFKPASGGTGTTIATTKTAQTRGVTSPSADYVRVTPDA